MTRHTTVFRRINDSVLHSCVDNPLGYLGFTQEDVLGHSANLFFAPRQKYDIHTRNSLRALLTVLAPTCSLWPSRYVGLARVLHSRVGIPIEMIIEDTADGIIEFRNPLKDLADLIGSGIIVNGHTIYMYTGWKCWISCFRWWLQNTNGTVKIGCVYAAVRSDFEHYRLSHSRILLGLSEELCGVTVDRSHVDLHLPFGSFSSSSRPTILFCLDRLPHGTIPPLNAGRKATLEFTAFSSSLRTLSTAQIISVIPFVISERPARRPRSLVSVLKQLSASCSSNLVVESISNVSIEYKHALHRAYESFSGEQKIREMPVSAESVGAIAWRRDMFIVALEAALLHQGWIERWAVQVIAK